jgi:hypothetical protein
MPADFRGLCCKKGQHRRLSSLRSTIMTMIVGLSVHTFCFVRLVSVIFTDQTTAMRRRRSPVNRLFGISACTPRTISTTWVTRKLTAMLQSP